jgi:hypothetical protein
MSSTARKWRSHIPDSLKSSNSPLIELQFPHLPSFKLLDPKGRPMPVWLYLVIAFFVFYLGAGAIFGLVFIRHFKKFPPEDTEKASSLLKNPNAAFPFFLLTWPLIMMPFILKRRSNDLKLNPGTKIHPTGTEQGYWIEDSLGKLWPFGDAITEPFSGRRQLISPFHPDETVYFTSLGVFFTDGAGASAPTSILKDAEEMSARLVFCVLTQSLTGGWALGADCSVYVWGDAQHFGDLSKEPKLYRITYLPGFEPRTDLIQAQIQQKPERAVPLKKDVPTPDLVTASGKGAEM